jgi:hypothetical protein
MEQIISELHSDEKYYGEFGKQFISNSDIDTLINNPSGYGIPTSETKDFLFGKAFHELVMIGETTHAEYVEASSRNTKIYKEAVIKAEKPILLLQKEYDQLMMCVDAVLGNKSAHEIIKEGDPDYEVPNVGMIFDNDQDVKWKGKADIINQGMIVDLKTTSARLSKFKGHAMQYNYDSQALKKILNQLVFLMSRESHMNTEKKKLTMRKKVISDTYLTKKNLCIMDRYKHDHAIAIIISILFFYLIFKL